MLTIFKTMPKISTQLCSALLLCYLANITAAEAAPQKVTVYVTVDWEGHSLDNDNDNIEAMQVFRQKHPNIAMLQLLNPVYYLRPDSNAAQINTQIQSTFLPIDAQGLHVHAWKSLVNYCNVPYKTAPSFADTDEACSAGDCGYTVSLEFAYSADELTQLIGCSSQILVAQGYAKPVHFRAGGWQMGPKLTAALQNNGFVWDSSHIDANLLTTNWHEESGMIKMLRALHGNSQTLAQPYELAAATSQPTGQHAALTEYPNNAALADYTSTKQLVALFKHLLAEQISVGKNSVLVLGFHQETAAAYLHRLDDAIPRFEAMAKAVNVELEWASYR